MEKRFKLIILTCAFIITTESLHAELWGDRVESKIDVIETEVSSGTIYLTSTDVVSGNITLSSAGHYTLAETLTTDITISGDCITLDLNDLCLTGSISISPSVSHDDITVQNGTVLVPGDYSNYAISLSSLSMRIRIAYLTIFTSTSATGDGPGGISIVASYSIIENCTIITGNGGVNASASGGNGIVALSSDHIFIRNCIISAGNGGGNGTNGGIGGRGIVMTAFCSDIEITDCTILKTGSGGNATSPGNGADGIGIGNNCSDISVHNCVISNTGAAGTGGGSPVAGKAIGDAVVAGASESQIYSNFAHNIANSIKYDLQASGVESGFLLSNPPSSTAVSIYANVFTS